MSFIDSIDKLINLTDLNNQPTKQLTQVTNKLPFENQTINANRSPIWPNVNSSSKLNVSSSIKFVASFVSSATAAAANDTRTRSAATTSNAFNESNASIANLAAVQNSTLNSHKIIKKMQALTRSANLTNERPSNRTTSVHEKRIVRLKTNQPIAALSKQLNNETVREPQHSERVLVYPIQANQSSDQSLSAQSKRAPHYLEEKYRVQALSTSTVSPDKNERLLDKPTPILDTQPLIEDTDSELNLRALDERLISEEELIHHHGSSSIEDSSSSGSYEYSGGGGGHHNGHHLNSHHSTKHEQQRTTNQTIDATWFEQHCPTNCSCDLNRKWPEINGQSRKTLNCSNTAFDDYPPLTNELSRHVERLTLADNRIRTLQINVDSFHCEKLIELDLSNNQLQQLTTTNSFSYKHLQHPVVEFHPSHNHHHPPKDEDSSMKSTLFTTNSTIGRLDETTTPISSSSSSTTTSQPKANNTTRTQHLFAHCHRLKILALADNDLNTLTTGCFRGLKRLRKLYLDNSQIRFIEKNAFLGANELRLLSLRFNLLTTVHSDMFQHMINLRVLDLTGNSLTYLGAGVFNSLVALQALHLGHNKIRQLSFQCFSGLDGLQLLTINSNQLKNVPRFALQPLKKMKILNMSGNPINRILEDDFSHSFVQLLLLNQLDQLQHVARFAFWDLPYLTELQISNCNEFAHLDEQAIVGAPALHRLRLDHNAIVKLDDRLLENLARMTIAARRRLKVYLAGNSFLCDCFLKPVYLVSNFQQKKKVLKSSKIL